MRGIGRRCRVAYLIGQLDRGGAERQLAQLALGLGKTEFSPVVCSLGTGGVWAPVLREGGVPVVEMGHHRGSFPGETWHLAAFLRRFRPDLLHAYLHPANWRALLLGPLLGRPRVVISERNVQRGRSRLRSALLRSLLVNADAITVNAGSIAEWFSKTYGVGVDSIWHIPNGVQLHDLASPSHEAEAVRRELGLGADEPVAAIVGSLTPKKDHRTFLRACASVLERLPEARFLVVGDGPLREEIREESARIDPRGRILLLGPRDDVPAILAVADLILLSSIIEGSPNVILEAMAAGRATICTDAGGCRELVQDGVTGYLVPVGDAEGLAEHALALLSDRGRARAMGAAGRRRVEEEFTMARMVERTTDLYRRLLGE